ncbi:MAG: thrombospondin type 3 repeat-containing protein [Chloroflexota bacterium]
MIKGLLRFSAIVSLFVFYSISFAQTEPDRDGDGVPDSTDSCISEPGPASNNGCPIPATTPSSAPVVPTEAPASNNPPQAPTNDDDGDGTLNDADACPQVGGPDWNAGCPTDAQSPLELTPTVSSLSVAPVVIDPNAPCSMSSGSVVVNRRTYASLLAPIAGTIQPGELFPVNFILITDEGAWYETTPWSWVFADVVQIGGNCDDLTIIELPDGADIMDEETAGSVSGLATGRRQHEPLRIQLPPVEESPNALVMQFPTILMTLIVPVDDRGYQLLPIPLDPEIDLIRFEMIDPSSTPPPSRDVLTIFHTAPQEGRVTVYVPSDEQDYIEMFINLPTPDPSDPDDDGSDPSPILFNDWQLPDDTSSCLWLWTNDILLPWGSGWFWEADQNKSFVGRFYVMTEDASATVNIQAELYEGEPYEGSILDTFEIRADDTLVADLPPSQFPVNAQFELVGDAYRLLIASQPAQLVQPFGTYTGTCSSDS